MINIANFIEIPTMADDRGDLIALETGADVPFEIKRTYAIFNTRDGKSRGFHAHKNLKQIMICLTGSCKVLIDNGRQREQVKLDTPTKGLLLESLIWRELSEFSKNTVVLVIASEIFDETDYIRDYTNFKEIAERSLLEDDHVKRNFSV